MADANSPTLADDGTDRKRIVNRLRRLEGQVRGLQAMIESDKECEAVLTQIMAAKSALNQVGMHVIGHAMKKCLVDENLTAREEIVSAAFSVYLRFRELSCANQVAVPTGAATPEQVLELLRQLETEIRSVHSAMSADVDCESALIELTAATATLNAVGLAVMGHAMQNCLIDEDTSSREEVIDSAIQVFLRYSSCVS